MRQALAARSRLLATGAAVVVTAGTLGLASPAGARTAPTSSGPVVMHGHVCTVVATRHHNRVVGHAGDVVCAPTGRATLKASGPGTVFLIAGSGRVKMIGSSSPTSHDVMIGGTGQDTIVTGNGDDTVDASNGSDNINCGSGTTTVVGAGSDDNESSDCQGSNVEDAALQFEGTITAVDGASPPASLTVSVSDAGDSASAWLAANPTCDPTALVVDLATTPATVEVDGGGPLVVGDSVEVEANAPASGCSPVAVTVQAQPGEGGSQTGGQGSDG